MLPTGHLCFGDVKEDRDNQAQWCLCSPRTQEAKDGEPRTPGQPELRREIPLQDRVRVGREREGRKSRKHTVLDRSFRYATAVAWVSENETPKNRPGTRWAFLLTAAGRPRQPSLVSP